MTTKEQIEEAMRKAGLKPDLGKGWDPTMIAIRAKEKAEKENAQR